MGLAQAHEVIQLLSARFQRRDALQCRCEGAGIAKRNDEVHERELSRNVAVEISCERGTELRLTYRGETRTQHVGLTGVLTFVSLFR
jgi:hypothetical protein